MFKKSKLQMIANVELHKVISIENNSGLPKKFKVPRPIIRFKTRKLK